MVLQQKVRWETSRLGPDNSSIRTQTKQFVSSRRSVIFFNIAWTCSLLCHYILKNQLLSTKQRSSSSPTWHFHWTICCTDWGIDFDELRKRIACWRRIDSFRAGLSQDSFFLVPSRPMQEHQSEKTTTKKEPETFVMIVGERIKSNSSIATDKVWLHSKIGKQWCDGAVVEEMMVNVFINTRLTKERQKILWILSRKRTHIKKILQPFPDFVNLTTWQHPRPTPTTPQSHLKPHLHQLNSGRQQNSKEVSNFSKKSKTKKTKTNKKRKNPKFNQKPSSASWSTWTMGVVEKIPNSIELETKPSVRSKKPKKKNQVFGDSERRHGDIEKDGSEACICIWGHIKSYFCLKATSKLLTVHPSLPKNKNIQPKNKNQICKRCQVLPSPLIISGMACFDICLCLFVFVCVCLFNCLLSCVWCLCLIVVELIWVFVELCLMFVFVCEFHFISKRFVIVELMSVCSPLSFFLLHSPSPVLDFDPHFFKTNVTSTNGLKNCAFVGNDCSNLAN